MISCFPLTLAQRILECVDIAISRNGNNDGQHPRVEGAVSRVAMCATEILMVRCTAQIKMITLVKSKMR
jgi:hypothetical protein